MLSLVIYFLAAIGLYAVIGFVVGWIIVIVDKEEPKWRRLSILLFVVGWPFLLLDRCSSRD